VTSQAERERKEADAVREGERAPESWDEEIADKLLSLQEAIVAARDMGPETETTARIMADLENAHEELRTADEEVRSQQRQYEDLVRSHRNRMWQHDRLLALVPSPVITTDMHGVVRTANAAASALLEVSVDRLIRKPVQAFLDVPDRSRVRHQLSRAVASQGLFRALVTLRPRDSAPMPAELIVVAGRDQVSRTEVTWLIMSPLGPTPTASDDRRRALLVGLMELTLLPVHTATTEETVTDMARICQAAIGGSCSVSVSVGSPTDPSMAATTSHIARDVDSAQAGAREGPSVTAFATGEVLRSDRLHHDPRWPRLVQRIADVPVNNAVTAPIHLGDEAVGTLNAYNVDPSELDGIPESVNLLGTAVAAVLYELDMKSQLQGLVENLRVALSSRAVIDQAKGVVMARNGGTAEEAFAYLADLSMRRNEKLRTIAQKVLEEARSGHRRP
jgi:PAS domain-containing protein